MLAIAALCLAAPLVEESFIRLERDVEPHDPVTSSFDNTGRAPAHTILSLTVQLSLDSTRRDALEEAFWAVSDPRNPRYGQHLDKAAIKDLLAVPAAQVERVRSFFLEAGAIKAKASPFNDVIAVKMAAGHVEKALRTTISTFTHHQRTDVHVLRASAPYHLPATLAADVALVGELLQFPRVRRSVLTSGGAGDWPNACDAKGCDGLVTPAVLGERYKVPVNESTAGDAKSTMPVAEFQGQVSAAHLLASLFLRLFFPRLTRLSSTLTAAAL